LLSRGTAWLRSFPGETGECSRFDGFTFGGEKVEFPSYNQSDCVRRKICFRAAVVISAGGEGFFSHKRVRQNMVTRFLLLSFVFCEAGYEAVWSRSGWSVGRAHVRGDGITETVDGKIDRRQHANAEGPGEKGERTSCAE